jgi:cytochrome c553
VTSHVARDDIADLAVYYAATPVTDGESPK